MEHFFKPYVCFGHISQRFTQNYQHNFSIGEICNLQIWKSFCVIRKGVSKYSSKLSMQAENWILRKFSSFAKSK